MRAAAADTAASGHKVHFSVTFHLSHLCLSFVCRVSHRSHLYLTRIREWVSYLPSLVFWVSCHTLSSSFLCTGFSRIVGSEILM